MGNPLISKHAISNYTKTMAQVIKDLSQCVLVYNPPTSIECINCDYDRIQNASSGRRNWKPITSTYTVFSGTSYQKIYYANRTDFTRGKCPVCFGQGRLFMPSISQINALVTWNVASTPTTGNPYSHPIYWPPGLEGKDCCRIKTESCNLNIILSAEYFEVEGHKMVLWNTPNLEGLGRTNRILIAFFIKAEEEYLPTNKGG